MLQQAKQWARIVKRDTHAIYLASRDPRVPWYAKVLALCVAGYALSPIDLIPDFVPVLGYLDDVIIVPLGILAVVKLIPPEIMAEHRALAAADASARNGSMAFMVASGNSSCTASLPCASRAVRMPGTAASASISARDFGGVSAP